MVLQARYFGGFLLLKGTLSKHAFRSEESARANGMQRRHSTCGSVSSEGQGVREAQVFVCALYMFF